MDETKILHIVLDFGILLFSLCLHEFGHALMANRLGDPTPRMLGRLTLDPRAHMDPFGTVLFPLLGLTFPNLLIFGWAKPVPITPENFRNPRKDGALVAFAGPLANMILFLFSLLGLFLMDRLGLEGGNESARYVLTGFLKNFFWINFALAVFNLIPIFPLDGSWIVKAILPNRWAYAYSRVDRYGAAILFAGFFLGWINWLFAPLVGGLYLILDFAGLGHLAGLIS